MSEKKTLFTSGFVQSSDELPVKATRIAFLANQELKEPDKKATLFEIENCLIQLKADMLIFDNFLEREKEKLNALQL